MTRLRDIVARTSKTYKLVFTDRATGEPIDITGYTIYLTLKRRRSDPDELAAIKKVITVENGVGGVAYIELNTIDTDIEPGSYYYQILYRRPSGGITPITFDDNKLNVVTNLLDSYG